MEPVALVSAVVALVPVAVVVAVVLAVAVVVPVVVEAVSVVVFVSDCVSSSDVLSSSSSDVTSLAFLRGLRPSPVTEAVAVVVVAEVDAEVDVVAVDVVGVSEVAPSSSSLEVDESLLPPLEASLSGVGMKDTFRLPMLLSV